MGVGRYNSGMSEPVRRQYQIYIERPVEAVFAFVSDLRNAPRLAPADAPESVASGMESALSAGAVVTYATRRTGSAESLTVQVEAWNPPTGYAERQIQGPFGAWVHRRRLAPFQSGTLLTDQVEYVAGGPLGALADRLWLGKHLDAWFRHRQSEAKRLLEQVTRIKNA